MVTLKQSLLQESWNAGTAGKRARKSKFSQFLVFIALTAPPRIIKEGRLHHDNTIYRKTGHSEVLQMGNSVIMSEQNKIVITTSNRILKQDINLPARTEIIIKVHLDSNRLKLTCARGLNPSSTERRPTLCEGG